MNRRFYLVQKNKELKNGVNTLKISPKKTKSLQLFLVPFREIYTPDLVD